MNSHKVLTLIGPLTCSLLLSLGCSSASRTTEDKIDFLQASEVSSETESTNDPLDEDEPVDISNISVAEPSSFPRICQAWNGVQNRPDSTTLENIARHDLYWDTPYSFDLLWKATEEQPYQGLSTILVDTDNDPALTKAKKLKEELLRLNPNIKTLISVEYREGKIELNEDDLEWWEYGLYPPESPFWFWDTNGNPVPGWGEEIGRASCRERV